MVFQVTQKDWVACNGHYEKGFVSYLQGGLKPPSYRAFDADSGVWRFYYTRLPEVAKVARSQFDEVDWSELPTDWQMFIVGGKTPQPRSQAVNKSVDKSPYSILFVTPEAPLSVIQASYKVLAKTYHPDVSGDPVKMVELNGAMDEIRKERGCG